MEKTNLKRISALFLAVTIAVSPIFNLMESRPYHISAEEIKIEEVTIDNLNYQFENTKAGYADGIITVTSNSDTDFDLYWGDATGQKLKRDGIYYSSLGSVTTSDGEGSFDVISSYTAIPDGAKTLLVYCEDSLKYTYRIPSNKTFNAQKEVYSFGALSDIHYNRYKESGTDDAIKAFNKALTFMEKTAKVSFVGVAGDLSSYGEETAFQKYNSELKKHNLTVYTCMGNHDVYSSTNWKKYINTGIQAADAKKKGILNVADNNLDFVYQTPSSTQDVFIFLSQTKWAYNAPSSILLTDDQLYWLEEMLAAYSNKNVYLFFHTYLAADDGNVKMCTGNLINPGGYFYDLTYTFGNKDEKKLRYLLKKYSNVTMLSGHSHWAYSMQIYNPTLNIGKLSTGATLLHVSSVTEPRIIGKNDSSRTPLNNVASEGTLVTVYDNCVVYTSIDLWNNQYEAYATYISPNGAKTTPVKINYPAKVKIKKAVKKKEKSTTAQITFSKVNYAVGYEIRYSTSKKFTSKTTKLKTTKKTTYTIKKIKAKKKYYTQVRAYNVAYNKKRYGKWSNTKTIKIKKS